MDMGRGPTPDEHVQLEVDTRFDAFYRDEYTRTVRLARLLTGNPDIAEDIAHEAFARLHRSHPTLADLDNPGAYLHTITVNLCRNHHRSTTREADRLHRLAPRREHEPDPTDARAAADHLAGLVDRLPYRQRAVLVLRYWLDLTEADIATHLHCRPGTVKSLHARALTKIRTEIAP